MAVEQHEASASPAMPRVVAIVGPTASGKASLGRLAARRLSLPVLVCDSVKVYRGLDIGSAKPTPEQRAELRHELVDLVDPDEPFSAGDYARHAWPHLSAGRGLVVGGTGFYLRAALVSQSGASAGAEGGDDGLPQRSAAMYGMMGTLPNRGDLHELVLDLLSSFTES